MAPKNKILVINQEIDNLQLNDVLHRIISAIKNNQQLKIATVNPEFMVLSMKDDNFAKTLENFDIKVPDGVGITLLPKIFKGEVFTQRITGVDLSWKLFEMANKNHYKVLMLGSTNKNSSAACTRLRRIFPTLNIKCISGGKIDPFNPTEKLIEDISDFKPNILLVGLGSPKQEYFISSNEKLLKYNVAVGVGGTTDFIAETTKRAPNALRQIGLEWLWRLMFEPRRFKRIFNATIVFPYLYIKSLIKKRT